MLITQPTNALDGLTARLVPGCVQKAQKYTGAPEAVQRMRKDSFVALRTFELTRSLGYVRPPHKKAVRDTKVVISAEAKTQNAGQYQLPPSRAKGS